MSEINEQAQAIEQEEQAQITTEHEKEQEEVITLSKSEFNKLNRTKFAYDALKKQAPQTQKEIEPEFVSRLSKIEQIESKRQFGFENDLSPKEVDYIFKHSQGSPTKELLADPFVQGGLERLRQSDRVTNNTPGSTSNGFLQTGKEFKDLTEDERRSAFEGDMKRRREQ